MSQYFPKPYKNFEGNINVKIDLSNYVTKAELKNATVIDTSKLASRSYLASLKAEIDKMDVDKLKTVPVDLSKLGHVVNNDVAKRTVYDKLVAKVNNIDTSGFVLKTKYTADKSNLEKNISDAYKKILMLVNLLKKQIIVLESKVEIEIESKIPSISGLATNSALTAAKNKIPDMSNLVKETDYDANISEIEKKLTDQDRDKYITTSEFNNLTVKSHCKVSTSKFSNKDRF